MSEKYYAVERNGAYLAHLNEAGTGGGSLIRKNHKYVARVPKAGGGYRYFYSTFEVDAYKRARAKGWGEGKSAEAAPSDTRSLREKWEERRGLLKETGSGKGSGGKGGSGKGSSGKRKGGSGKGSASEKTQKMSALYRGNLKQERAYEAALNPSLNERIKKKSKSKKSSSGNRFASAYTPYVIRRR